MGNAEASETVETAERLWTVRDCAKYLNVSRKWVYSHAQAGDLPHSWLGGTALRFHPARIREYAQTLTGGAKVVPLRPLRKC